MNWRIIALVFGKELRDSLRDRRTLISMIVIPVLAIPLLSVGMGLLMFKSMKTAQAETPRIMVAGGENSPRIRAALAADKGFKLVPVTTDFTNQIVEKRIRAVVRLPADFDAAVSNGMPARVEIFEYAGEVKSGFAAENLDRFFRNLKDATVRERLAKQGLPADLIKPFAVLRQNVAPPAKVTGNALGAILPYFIIVLCLTGAMHPAIDLTAGEKERGTMETILCSPVARINLVLGKFLMVLTASMATVLLSLGSMGGTFIVGKHALAHSLPPEVLRSITLLDAGSVAGVFLLLLPVAVMLSALLLMVGLFSKSFREAQSYAGPLMLVAIVPTIVAAMPGMELTPGLALAPLVNVCLACKEIMAGIWHWPYLLLIFGSASLYAALALAATVWMFHREDVIFRS